MSALGTTGKPRALTWFVPMKRVEPPAKPIRVYRDKLTSALIWCWVSLVVVLLLVLAAGGPVPLAERLAALLAAALSVWIGRRSARMRLAITAEGVWLRTILYARWIPWTEIERFIATPWGFYSQIRLEVDGGRTYRAPLIQGRTMRWEYGRTKDVLAALNTDLAAARERRTIAPAER